MLEEVVKLPLPLVWLPPNTGPINKGCKALPQGVHTLFIFCIHMRSGPIYLGGYLPCKKDYKVMVFYMERA